MSRLVGVLIAASVVVLAMAFAAANGGNQVTLNLGLFTVYRAPVALVAFGGLFTGMVVMFATGIHSDLKVRRILRERLAEEAREEQKWIDRNQRDLFDSHPEPPSLPEASAPGSASTEPSSREASVPEASAPGSASTEPPSAAPAATAPSPPEPSSPEPVSPAPPSAAPSSPEPSPPGPASPPSPGVPPEVEGEGLPGRERGGETAPGKEPGMS